MRRQPPKVIVAVGSLAAVGALVWSPDTVPDVRLATATDWIVGNIERQTKKHEIVGELVDGTITLAQAVDRCIALDDVYAYPAAALRPFIERDYAGRTYAEKTALNLIVYAETLLDGNANRDEITARLVAQKEAADGKIESPRGIYVH